MSARAGWARAAALAASLALCSCRGVQTMLDPVGDQARHVDLIWRAMLWVCGAMYLLVMAGLAWALIRAWRRRGPLAPPPAPASGPTPAEPLLARGLTAWTGLVVAGLIGLITVSFLVDRSLAEATPDPLKIKVTARQWWWQVDYEGQQDADVVTTANELKLPLDRPAVIELHAGDVIHSFWVPNLAGKVDLIPGRTNYVAVTPRRTGVFRGQCAEFCGLEHAKMAFDVQVVPAQDFEAWRAHLREEAAQPGDPASTHGRDVFLSKACVMCHRISGTDAGATVGPDLTHVASRSHLAAGALPNTRAAMQAWIADPQGQKPGTPMPRVALSADELNDLAIYLETLK
jgi:cytochrome c oxidase subunit 2